MEVIVGWYLIEENAGIRGIDQTCHCFPNRGPFTLKQSADAKIKIWVVYFDWELLQTYNGHSKSITNITFNNNGKQFLHLYDR